MDDKGFGIPELLGFAILVIFIIFSAYNFISQTFGEFFKSSSYTPNYVNVYKKYYDNGVLTINASSKTDSNTIDNNSYSSLEIVLEDATKSYVNEFYSNLNENDPLYIKASSLRKYGYLNNFKDINDGSNCSGYTRVEKINSSLKYTPFIKCSGYTTDGYISRLDN